jgi:hypothetical protein
MMVDHWSICRTITIAFQEYLQDRFPLARVTIRNGHHETVALAFARLVMAHHAFAAPSSTFSLFPVLASFGRGYHIRAVEGSMNEGLSMYAWLVENDPSVVFIDPDTILPVALTSVLRETRPKTAGQTILTWFQNDTFEINNENGFDWMRKWEKAQK